MAPAAPDLLAAGGDMATAANTQPPVTGAASALRQSAASTGLPAQPPAAAENLRMPAAVPFAAAPAAPGAPPLRDLLQERGIVLRNYSPGQYTHLSCPQCQGGNNNDHDLTVNITTDGQSAQWLCFRASCGFKGGVTVGSSPAPAKLQTGDSRKDSRKMDATAPEYVLPKPSWRPLGPEALEFFRQRGISAATLERNGVMEESLRWSAAGQPSTTIAFPYKRGEQLLNIKYRSLDKKAFRQVKGAEKVLFGLNDIAGMPEIIIVEGEMDKLALEEAGFRNVVSVPDGAPQRAKTGALPPPDQDVKYSYLWNCRGELDQAARIVIATDNDAPGQALAEELSRRLGRERCWRVRWPGAGAAPAEDGMVDPGFRKDANQVLMDDGAEALQACIDTAEPYPIRGLFRFSDFWDEIKAYHGMQQTSDIAVSTGWKSVDEFYRIVPGELTIITGVPNSGKSEWIDALLCNLTHQHGWSFALCSMEKKVTDHARQLLEKHLGLPFLNAGYSGPAPRMSLQQVEEGMQWLDDCFHLIRCQDDELPSIDWVLDLARAAVLRYGIRGLVIDPYNELDHQRPGAMSETEYVSQMLTKIKRFAQHHDVHVWFVAHPRQMRDWKGDPPNLYDISGSAHFINKCDNGVVVHRNNDPNKGPQSEVNILIRKVRNKAAGSIGNAYLTYDRKTGRYKDAVYETNG